MHPAAGRPNYLLSHCSPPEPNSHRRWQTASVLQSYVVTKHLSFIEFAAELGQWDVSPLLLLCLPQKALKNVNHCDRPVLTGARRKSPACGYVPFPAPSLKKTSTSKSRSVFACLVCQIWMLLLFHNRQAVLAKAQPTVAIISCQQHSLEAVASSSSCCLQTRCQYFLAGSTARSHKSFLYFQIYHYGYVWPFQDRRITCVSANINGPWEGLCFNKVDVFHPQRARCVLEWNKCFRNLALPLLILYLQPTVKAFFSLTSNTIWKTLHFISLFLPSCPWMQVLLDHTQGPLCDPAGSSALLVPPEASQSTSGRTRVAPGEV